ncbi:MAG: adenosine deaminase [Verrucomicrobiota bacterium]
MKTDDERPLPSRRSLLKSGLAALVSAPVLGTGAIAATASKPPLARAVLQGPAVTNPANMDLLFERIKREASDEELYRFLYAMPKGGDIHHHLAGGFLPAMWYSIASDSKRNGGQRFYTRYRITDYRRHPLLSRPGVSNIFLWINLREDNVEKLDASLRVDFKPLDELTEAEQAAWMSAIVLDLPHEGRNEFFEYHWSRLGDMSTSIHVMSELMVENMKLFGAEGVRYLEVQRGAFHYLDAKGNSIPVEESEAFWNARLSQPDALATGVTVRWQGIVLRFADNALDMVRTWYAFLDSHSSNWAGINMAGREDDNRGYPKRFTAVYDEMLRKYPGIGISIHAGEAEKPDTHIPDTLRLGATRIGHGINLIWDEDTMLRMRDSEFLIEINLISNELLGYVPDLDQHPFPVFLRQGIPCCLNTDDRGMWDSNFTDEVYVAVKRFNLSWSELQKTARLSLEHSFADPILKTSLLSEYQSDLEAFSAQFNDSNWRAICAAVPAITHAYGIEKLGLSLG